MLERSIEKRLVTEVKAIDGLCLKFTSPSMAGVPDRIVLLPEGKLGFVEVKAKGKKPRPLQVRRIKQLRSLGFKVFVLDDQKDIERILNKIGGDA